MDWTAMILKMYTSWAARRKFQRMLHLYLHRLIAKNSVLICFFVFFCFFIVEVLHQNNGDVGIKSVSCKLSGDFAYHNLSMRGEENREIPFAHFIEVV